MNLQHIILISLFASSVYSQHQVSDNLIDVCVGGIKNSISVVKSVDIPTIMKEDVRLAASKLIEIFKKARESLKQCPKIIDEKIIESIAKKNESRVCSLLL